MPSKRARKTPEKIQVSQDDLAELSQTAKPEIDSSVNDENVSEEGDVSLDEVTENEIQKDIETSSEDNEASNS